MPEIWGQGYSYRFCHRGGPVGGETSRVPFVGTLSLRFMTHNTIRLSRAEKKQLTIFRFDPAKFFTSFAYFLSSGWLDQLTVFFCIWKVTVLGLRLFLFWYVPPNLFAHFLPEGKLNIENILSIYSNIGYTNVFDNFREKTVKICPGHT